eukprot:CCRYP_006336-RA/>CCRYP_006336-RA protein AED:0.33 eAED:0.29 QI:0/-1/0/1/-1/1/1/0/654
MPLKMTKDAGDNIPDPPMVRRRSTAESPLKHPGTPTSTATTTSTIRSSNAGGLNANKKVMEVTITVLSLDGLIAKLDETKERTSLLKDGLSNLSSHGLSLSKHGLTRLSSHGKRKTDEDEQKKSTCKTKDGLCRLSSHGTSRTTESPPKEKSVSTKAGSLSISCDEKRTTNEDIVSNDSVSSKKPETATLVASFSHSLTKKDVLFTHIPSHPMQLALKSTVQPIAYWSSKVDLDDADQALSTLKFKRPFVEDSNVPNKYIPQKCPISLSVSRNGRLIKIGSADVVINGNEDGERSLSALVISNTKTAKSKRPTAMYKGKDTYPMFKAKGDNVSFGLRPDAKLRVLVHVGEPRAKVCARKKLETEHDFPIKEIKHKAELHDFPIKEIIERVENKAERHDFPIKEIIERVENKTDSNCTEEASECSTEQEVWEEYVVEDNELRHLREQLAKSEHANKILQHEIAESRDALQLENEKYEQFCWELEQVKQKSDSTIESLREELHVARCEAAMLPVYEARITELLEELKSKEDQLKKRAEELKEKDEEIACLREEIQEVRVGFKSQVDALLWDAEDNSHVDDQSIHSHLTSLSQQSQPKTDKWLAAELSKEFVGFKNAFLRKDLRRQPSMDEFAVASNKSVRWEHVEEEVNLVSDDEA